MNKKVMVQSQLEVISANCLCDVKLLLARYVGVYKENPRDVIVLHACLNCELTLFKVYAVACRAENTESWGGAEIRSSYHRFLREFKIELPDDRLFLALRDYYYKSFVCAEWDRETNKQEIYDTMEQLYGNLSLPDKDTLFAYLVNSKEDNMTLSFVHRGVNHKDIAITTDINKGDE